MNKSPLLFLGYANVDLVASVPHLPKVGERVTALPTRVFPGGMAANAACAAANLGADVFFFGNIGRDDFGRLLLEDFRHHGVHTEYITRVKRTTVCLITVTPEGERTIISEPFEYQPKKLQGWLESYRGIPGFLYVDGYHLCVAKQELKLAKSKGLTLFCDLDGALDTYTVAEIAQTLQLIDVLQVTQDLLKRLSQEGLRLERLQTLLPVVIVTNGAHDILVYSPNLQHFPVPKVQVVDTTGAGDAFAGSFLVAYSVAKDLSASVKVAVQQSATIVGVAGTRLPPSSTQHLAQKPDYDNET